MISSKVVGIELDNIKLTAMKFKIIHLEKINVKTKEKNNLEMIEAIRKIIIDEVNKNI